MGDYYSKKNEDCSTSLADKRVKDTDNENTSTYVK